MHILLAPSQETDLPSNSPQFGCRWLRGSNRSRALRAQGELALLKDKRVLESLTLLDPKNSAGPLDELDPIEAEVPEILCGLTPDRQQPGILEQRQS
jgi:hypothetical protein